MKVLLVDDEPLALDRLANLLEGCEGAEVVGRAGDADQAVTAIAALRPDLLLLDIQMPGRDGLSLARTLADADVEVVFVTAFDQFAVQAFDIDAVDYLLKPVEPERLKLALARAARRRTRPAPPALEQAAAAPSPPVEGYISSLWVPRRDGVVRVDLDTVEWIEAARDYVLVHTASHSHILRATMDGLARQFDPQVMVRVSRSAFVRRAAVTALERQGRDLFLVLSGQACIRVGTTFAGVVESQFRGSPALA